MKPIYGDTLSNDSYYSTSCSYSSESGQTHHGSRMDRFFHKKHLPFRESTLLEKLVKTKALYEDLRSQLLSSGFISRMPDLKPGKQSSVIGKKLEETKSDIVAFVDLVDKGVIFTPKKLTKCSSYCDSTTRLKYGPKDCIQKQYHTREHLTSKSSIISKIRTGEESRLGIQSKTKNIKSDPCTCIFKYGENFKKEPRDVLRRVNPEQNVKYHRDRNKKTLRRLKRSNPRVVEAAKRSVTKLKQQSNKDAESFKSSMKKSLDKITKQCHAMSFKSSCSPNMTEKSLAPDPSFMNKNEPASRENLKKNKFMKAQDKVLAERKTTEEKILSSRNTPNKITLPDHIIPQDPNNSESRCSTGACQIKNSQERHNKYFKMMAKLLSKRSKKSVPRSSTGTKNEVNSGILVTGSKRNAATKPENLITYRQPVKSTLAEKSCSVENRYSNSRQTDRNILPDVMPYDERERNALKLPRLNEQYTKENSIDVKTYEMLTIKSKKCLHNHHHDDRAQRRCLCALKPSVADIINVKQRTSDVISTENAKARTLHSFKGNISKISSTLFPCEPYVNTLSVPVKSKSGLKLRKISYPVRPCNKMPVPNESSKSLTTGSSRQIRVDSTKQHLIDNKMVFPLPKYLNKRGKQMVSISGAFKSKNNLSKHNLRRCLCSLELGKKDIGSIPSKPTHYKRIVLPLIYIDIGHRTLPDPVNAGIHDPVSTERKTYLHQKMKHGIWTRKHASCIPRRKVLIKTDIKKLKKQLKTSTDGQQTTASPISESFHLPRTRKVLSSLVTYKSDANTLLGTDNQEQIYDNPSQMLSNETKSDSIKIHDTKSLASKGGIRHVTKSKALPFIEESDLMISPATNQSFYTLQLHKSSKCDANASESNESINENMNSDGKPATRGSTNKSVKMLTPSQPYVYRLDIDGSQDNDYHKCSEKHKRFRTFLIMNIETAIQNPQMSQSTPGDAFGNLKRFHDLSERHKKFKLTHSHSKNHSNIKMTETNILSDSVNKNTFCDTIKSKKEVDILLPKISIKPAYKPEQIKGQDSFKSDESSHSSSSQKQYEKSRSIISKSSPTDNTPYEIPKLKQMYAVSKTIQTPKKIIINRGNSQSSIITKNTLNSLTQRYFDKNSSSSIISVSSFAFNSKTVNSFFHESKLKLFQVCSTDLCSFNSTSEETQKIKSKFSCEMKFSKQFITRSSQQKQTVNKSKKYPVVLRQYDRRSLESYDTSIYPSQMIKPIRANRQLTGVPSLLRRCYCTMNIKVGGQGGTRKSSQPFELYKCESGVGVLDECDSCEFQKFTMERLVQRASKLSTTDNKSSSTSRPRNVTSISHTDILRSSPFKEIGKVLKCHTVKHQQSFSESTSKRLNTNVHEPHRGSSLMRYVYRHTQSHSAMKKVRHKASTATPILKRCFCTFKLQKKINRHKVNEIHGKGVATDTKIKQVKPILGTADKGKTTNSKDKHPVLLQNKCESDLFVPGVCNPNECQELINERNTHTGGVDSGETHRQQCHHEPYEFKSDRCVPFTESRGSVVDLYKCETGVLGSCEPYECQNLIKISLAKDIWNNKQAFGTDRHGTKSVSSSRISLKSSEAGISQSMSQTTPKPRFKRTQSNLLSKSKEIAVSREEPTSESTSYRQAARIGSSFSFDTEFCTTGSDAIRSPRSKMHAEIISSRCSDHSGDSQMDIVDTADTAIGPMLKRCICALNLHKNQTQHKHPEACVVKVKPPLSPKYRVPGSRFRQQLADLQHRNVITVYKLKTYPYKLKPYECEPGVCVPGECDPYRCLERINRRRVDQGSSTDHLRTRHRDNKAQYHGREKRTFRDSQVESRVTRPETKTNGSSRSGSKQAVKLGSKCSFSVEFYKDRSRSGSSSSPKTQHRSGYERSKPERFKRTVSRPTHGLSISYRNKKTQRAKLGAHDSSSQVMAPSMRSTMTGVGPFLKRCFCTLQLQRQKNRKQKHDYENVSVGTETMKYRPEVHAIDRGTRTKKKYRPGRTLDPNECEPGVCVPGECDPYECPERIKRREMRSRGSGTERHRRHSPGGHMKSRSMKVQARERRMKTRYSHGRVRDRPAVIQRPSVENYDSPELAEAQSNRQAVRIGSSINFSIEFYKDRTRQASTAGPIKYSRGPTRRVGASRARLKNTRSVYTSQKRPTHRHRKCDCIHLNTRSQGSGTGLKRCFCTLKLQKIGKQQTTSRSMIGRTYRHAGTRPRRILEEKTVIGRDIGTRTRKRALEPYECEPGICTPGECDPYECLERIKRRNMRHSSTGMGRAGTRSMSSFTPRARRPVRKERRHAELHHKIRQPPRASRALENISNRQAVRLGSNFSFNVEFYKDRSRTATSACSPSICGGPTCTPSKCKTSSCSTTKCPLKSQGTYGASMNHHRKLQARGARTESRGSSSAGPLKRCFCTLTLQRAEVKTTMNALRSDNRNYYRTQDKMTITKNKYLNPQSGSHACAHGICPQDVCGPSKKMKHKKGRKGNVCLCEDSASIFSSKKYKDNRGNNRGNNRGGDEYPCYCEDNRRTYNENRRGGDEYNRGGDEYNRGGDEYPCYCEDNGRNYRETRRGGRERETKRGRGERENKRGGGEWETKRRRGERETKRGGGEQPCYCTESIVGTSSRHYEENKMGRRKKSKHSQPPSDTHPCAHGICPQDVCGTSKKKKNKKGKKGKKGNICLCEDSVVDNKEKRITDFRKEGGRKEERGSFVKSVFTKEGSSFLKSGKRVGNEYPCYCEDDKKKYKNYRRREEETKRGGGEQPCYCTEDLVGRRSKIRRVSRTTETSVKRSRRASPFELFARRSPYYEYEESQRVEPIVEEPRRFAKFFNKNPYTRNTVKITSNCELNIEFSRDISFPDSTVEIDGGDQFQGNQRDYSVYNRDRLNRDFKRTATELFRRCFCSRKNFKAEIDDRESEELSQNHKYSSSRRGGCLCSTNDFTVARVEVECPKPKLQNNNGSKTYMATRVDKTKHRWPAAGLLTKYLRSRCASKTVITPIIEGSNNRILDSRMLVNCSYKLFQAKSKLSCTKPVTAARLASSVKMKPVISKSKSLSAELPRSCFSSEKRLNYESEERGSGVVAAARVKKWDDKISTSVTKLFEVKYPGSMVPTKLKAESSPVNFARCFCTAKHHETKFKNRGSNDFKVTHTDKRRPLSIFTPKVYWVQYQIQHPRLLKLFKDKNKGADVPPELIKEDDKSSVGLKTIMSYSPIKFHQLKSKILLNSQSKDTSLAFQYVSKIPVGIVTKKYNENNKNVRSLPSDNRMTVEKNEINTEEIHTQEPNSLFTGRRLTVQKNKESITEESAPVPKSSHLTNLMARCLHLFSRRKNIEQVPEEAVISTISEQHVGTDVSASSSKSSKSSKNKGTTSVCIGKIPNHHDYQNLRYQVKNTGRNNDLPNTTLKARRKFVNKPNFYKKPFLQNKQTLSSLLSSKDGMHGIKITQKAKAIGAIPKRTGQPLFHFKNTTLKTRRKFVKYPCVHKKPFLKNRKHGMKKSRIVRKDRITVTVSEPTIIHHEIPDSFHLNLRRGSSKVNADHKPYNSSNYADYIKPQIKTTAIINHVETSWELKRLLLSDNRYCEIKHIVPSGETGDCEVVFVIKSEKETEKIASDKKNQANLDVLKMSEAEMKIEQLEKENEKKNLNVRRSVGQEKDEKLKIKQVIENENASNNVLLTESLLDVTKQVIICCAKEILRIGNRRYTDSNHQTLKNMVLPTFENDILPEKAITDSKNSSVKIAGNASVKRIGMRLRPVSQVKIIKEAIKQNPTLNRLFFNLGNSKEKMRLKPLRLRNAHFKDNQLYLGSLRCRPCLCFYPQCINVMRRICRRCTDVLLFVLAVVVWSPCLVSYELCRHVLWHLLRTG